MRGDTNVVGEMYVLFTCLCYRFGRLFLCQWLLLKSENKK
jgi:hypothetical protein